MAAATRTATWTGDVDDPYFMGYWIKSEEATPAPYETVRITAHTPWVTSGTYAGDCDELDDPCMLATECTTSGSVLKLLSADSSSSECSFEQKCHTLTIYASSPEGRPTAYNVACREEDWSMDTLFRVSPTTSSDVSRRTNTDSPLNGNGGIYRSGLSSPLMAFIILGACLLVGLFIGFGIWLPFHRRKLRKAKEAQSQMEISTFAQTRGYPADGEAVAAQAAQAAPESTVADTRNATIGETVPSTVDFGPDQTSRQSSDAAAQSQNGPAPGPGNQDTSR